MKKAFGFHLQDHCWIVPGKAESTSELVASAFIGGVLHLPETKQDGSSTCLHSTCPCVTGHLMHLVHRQTCSPAYFSTSSAECVEEVSRTLVNAFQQLWCLQNSRKCLGVTFALRLLFVTLSAQSFLQSWWGGEKDANSWNSTSSSFMTWLKTHQLLNLHHSLTTLSNIHNWSQEDQIAHRDFIHLMKHHFFPGYQEKTILLQGWCSWGEQWHTRRTVSYSRNSHPG